MNTDSLDDLLIDENVSTDGVWVQPDPDRALRIKTRGYPDDYYDAQARIQRQAAKSFNGDTDRLPMQIKRKINATCLIKHSLMDVQNCVVRGDELTFEQFCDLIQEERGKKLLGLAFTAAGMATETKAEDMKEAEGN